MGSLSILEKLFHFSKTENNQNFLAKTLQTNGNLLKRLRLDNLTRPMYDQAENLFRQEHDNLVWANTLKSLGDLLSHLGKLDRALEMYDQVENLFRQERNNL